MFDRKFVRKARIDRRILLDHAGYDCPSGSVFQLGSKRNEQCRGTGRINLDAAIAQVFHVTGYAEAQRGAVSKPPISHTLHHSADEVAFGSVSLVHSRRDA
jgi:hypothetical protein